MSHHSSKSLYRRVAYRKTATLSEYVHEKKSEQVNDALFRLQNLLSDQVDVSVANYEKLGTSSAKLGMLSDVYKKMDDTVKAASKTFKRLSRTKYFYRHLFFIALYIYIAIILFVVFKRIFPWRLVFFSKHFE